MGIEMTGAEQFTQLARDLKNGGEKALQKELYQAQSRVVKPLRQAAIYSALFTLPHTGGRDIRKTRLRKTGTVELFGTEYATRERVTLDTFRPNESLAERVAQSRFTVDRRAGKNPSIKVTARSKAGKRAALGSIDDGNVRHPVHAHGPRPFWAWVDQHVEPGWFSKPANEQLPNIHQEMVNAIQAVAAKLGTPGGTEA